MSFCALLFSWATCFIHLVETFFIVSEIDIIIIIHHHHQQQQQHFLLLLCLLNGLAQSALFFNHSFQFLILHLMMSVQSFAICFVVNKYGKPLYKDLLVKILEV